jgi:hypothetical protein
MGGSTQSNEFDKQIDDYKVWREKEDAKNDRNFVISMLIVVVAVFVIYNFPSK